MSIDTNNHDVTFAPISTEVSPSDPSESEDFLRSSPFIVEDPSERIKQAATTILKVGSTINLLRDPRIRTLNEYDFLKWLKIVAPLIEKGLENPETALLIETEFFQLIEIRNATEKESIPIFRAFGSIQKGKIVAYPQYDWVDLDSLPPLFGYPKEATDVDFKPLITCNSLFHTLYKKQTTHTRATKENLAEAFNYICTQKHLGWKYKYDKCFARASATVEYLLALGFKKARIFNAVLIGNNLGPPFDPEEEEYPASWSYHIAAGLEMETGARYVIDLSLCKKHPLSLDQWEYQARSDQTQIYSPANTLDRREIGITPKEIALLQKLENRTIILVPFNTSCFNRQESGYSTSISTLSVEEKFANYLGNKDAFQISTLKKVNALTLERHFRNTPLLLDILLTHPDLPYKQLEMEEASLFPTS